VEGALTRDAHDRAVLLGRRAVLEALRAGQPISRVLLSRTARPHGPLAEIERGARERGIPVDVVDAPRLDGLAGGVPHQGVAAFGAAQRLVDLDDLLRGAREKGEAPFVIALDGIEDPRNLGAVIRTAEAAGAHGVIIPRRRAAGLGPSAVRASAGATAYLPVAGVTNLAAALDHLKRHGVWVIGADAGASEPYDGGALVPPLALVVGGEGRGLHRLVRARCDRLVRIPLWGRVESLNASVAAALLLYEVARRRGAARPDGSGPAIASGARKPSIDLA
jgi:23S rRNA (guanosine2251-2'-O)-methyltransferase